MNELTKEIRNYYDSIYNFSNGFNYGGSTIEKNGKYYHITEHYIYPLKRDRLLVGALVATILLIKQVVLCTFDLIRNLFTLCLNYDYRTSLSKNIWKGSVNASSIFVGLAGSLFPETVNQRVFGIPADGLSTVISSVEIDHPPKTFTEALSLGII